MSTETIGTYSVADMRKIIVTEAQSFVGTPYEKGGCIKGVGVDCASVIFLVLRNCGLIGDEERGIFSDPSIVPVSNDWFRNTNVEKYMLRVIRHAYKIAEGVGYPSMKANPGDIALVRCGNSKIFNHGGIVVQWPKVIHAAPPFVEMIDVSRSDLWSFHHVAIFDVATRKTEGDRWE